MSVPVGERLQLIDVLLCGKRMAGTGYGFVTGSPPGTEKELLPSRGHSEFLSSPIYTSWMLSSAPTTDQWLLNREYYEIKTNSKTQEQEKPAHLHCVWTWLVV